MPLSTTQPNNPPGIFPGLHIFASHHRLNPRIGSKKKGFLFSRVGLGPVGSGVQEVYEIPTGRVRSSLIDPGFDPFRDHHSWYFCPCHRQSAHQQSRPSSRSFTSRFARRKETRHYKTGPSADLTKNACVSIYHIIPYQVPGK